MAENVITVRLQADPSSLAANSPGPSSGAGSGAGTPSNGQSNNASNAGAGPSQPTRPAGGDDTSPSSPSGTPKTYGINGGGSAAGGGVRDFVIVEAINRTNELVRLAAQPAFGGVGGRGGQRAIGYGVGSGVEEFGAGGGSGGKYGVANGDAGGGSSPMAVFFNLLIGMEHTLRQSLQVQMQLLQIAMAGATGGIGGGPAALGFTPDDPSKKFTDMIAVLTKKIAVPLMVLELAVDAFGKTVNHAAATDRISASRTGNILNNNYNESKIDDINQEREDTHLKFGLANTSVTATGLGAGMALGGPVGGLLGAGIGKAIGYGVESIGNGINDPIYNARTAEQEKIIKNRESFRNRTDRLSDYSPELATLKANRETNQYRRDIGESQIVGGALSEVEQKQQANDLLKQQILILRKGDEADKMKVELAKENNQLTKEFEKEAKKRDANLVAAVRALGEQEPPSIETLRSGALDWPEADRKDTALASDDRDGREREAFVNLPAFRRR